MKTTRNLFGLLLVTLMLCAASYAQDLKALDISKKKSVDHAALEAVTDLEYLKADHQLLEEKSAAQARTIEAQDKLIANLREQVSQRDAIIADYKEVITAQKTFMASAEASLKQYAAELQKVRADRDKKSGGKLKAFITGAAVVGALKLLL